MSVKGGFNLANNASVGKTVTWRGGKAALVASAASWNAGSVKLQIVASNGTAVTIANTTLSADGMIIIDLPPGQIGLLIATTTNVYADLIQIPAE